MFNVSAAAEEPASQDQSRAIIKQMAYLGPPGTYGQQAAISFAKHLPEQPELVPCPDITCTHLIFAFPWHLANPHQAIYSHPADYLVMPLHNTVKGSVIETLDCFLSVRSSSQSTNAEAGPSRPRIVGDLSLAIRHCLVAKRGVTMEDIEWVRSHEQALGQCEPFLSKHLASADRQEWPSTAGAAVSLLEDTDDGAGPGAAICSKSVLGSHPELELLAEGIQSVPDNYTRFLLLVRNHAPIPQHTPASDRTFFYVTSSSAMFIGLVKDGSMCRFFLPPTSGESCLERRMMELRTLGEGIEPEAWASHPGDSLEYLGTCGFHTTPK